MSIVGTQEILTDSQQAGYEKALTGKKRRRLTGAAAEGEAVLDAQQDKRFAEGVLASAVCWVHENNIVWPNGVAHVQTQLMEQIPDHYWVVVRYQENNLMVSQPANNAYVLLWRDYLVMGFPREIEH